LVYLSSQVSDKEPSRKTIFLFGVIITFGVILFMFLTGLVFTTIFEVSLTSVVLIVSPIVFGILFIISMAIIVASIISFISHTGLDTWRFLPKGRVPMAKNPWVSAFLYGFFFGAIVISGLLLVYLPGRCQPSILWKIFSLPVLWRWCWFSTTGTGCSFFGGHRYYNQLPHQAR
jgi:cytochrome c-type biogenesis protein